MNHTVTTGHETTDSVLAVKGVRKLFGGLEVLSDISIDAYGGETLALIGPNGAGKTTLFNIIAGVLAPDRGRIELHGKNITRQKPHARCHLGIARTFQIPKPFVELTVMENVDVALQFGHHGDRSRQRDQALTWLHRVGLDRWLHEPASTLPLGARKKLELVRALATEPSVILCDEVMGGLSPEEVDEVSAIVRGLGDEGIAVVFVEHVMRAIMNVADRAVVLHQGYIIAEGTPQQVANNPEVIEAYMGSEHTTVTE